MFALFSAPLLQRFENHFHSLSTLALVFCLFAFHFHFNPLQIYERNKFFSSFSLLEGFKARPRRRRGFTWRESFFSHPKNAVQDPRTVCTARSDILLLRCSERNWTGMRKSPSTEQQPAVCFRVRIFFALLALVVGGACFALLSRLRPTFAFFCFDGTKFRFGLTQPVAGGDTETSGINLTFHSRNPRTSEASADAMRKLLRRRGSSKPFPRFFFGEANFSSPPHVRRSLTW